MAPEGNNEITKAAPPPLPARLVNLPLLVVVGTAVWLVAWVLLLVTGGDRAWQWIALAGLVLGGIGMLIMWWQRSASRRGARGAQRGL